MGSLSSMCFIAPSQGIRCESGPRCVSSFDALQPKVYGIKCSSAGLHPTSKRSEDAGDPVNGPLAPDALWSETFGSTIGCGAGMIKAKS
jgi:hypothetical protein